MGTRWILGVALLCLLTTGCQLAETSLSNISYEAKRAAGEHFEQCRYRKLAQKHWNSLHGSYVRCQPSKACKEGFLAGFTDYLQFGGNGRPPYIPPRQYWGPRYRTPEGYQDVEDWYAGFRQGVAEAQASGLRRFATVPSVAALEDSSASAHHGASESQPLPNPGPGHGQSQYLAIEDEKARLAMGGGEHIVVVPSRLGASCRTRRPLCWRPGLALQRIATLRRVAVGRTVEFEIHGAMESSE